MLTVWACLFWNNYPCWGLFLLVRSGLPDSANKVSQLCLQIGMVANKLLRYVAFKKGRYLKPSLVRGHPAGNNLEQPVAGHKYQCLEWFTVTGLHLGLILRAFSAREPRCFLPTGLPTWTLTTSWGCLTWRKSCQKLRLGKEITLRMKVSVKPASICRGCLQLGFAGKQNF